MKKPKGQHHNEDLKSVQRWEVLGEDDSDASFLEGIADAGIIIRNMPLVQRKQKCLCVWMEGMWLRSRKGREYVVALKERRLEVPDLCFGISSLS